MLGAKGALEHQATKAEGEVCRALGCCRCVRCRYGECKHIRTTHVVLNCNCSGAMHFISFDVDNLVV